LLFILGATLFNVLVALAGFFLLAILYVKLLMMRLPEDNRAWGFTLIFLASIVISFIVYRIVLKFLLAKVDIEKYFDPLFVRNRKIKKG